MIAIERTGKFSVVLRCDQDGIKELERAFAQASQLGRAAITSYVESNLFNKPASKTLLAFALEIITSDEDVVRLRSSRTIEFRLDEDTVRYVAYSLHQILERGYVFPAELFDTNLENYEQEVTFYCHASL